MGAYIQRKSDGKILHSCSGQSVAKDSASLQEFITSRGWALADYTIADGDEATIKALIASAVTPMETWEQNIKATDATCPRWFEDYVTENSITLAPGRVKDNYDAKVALRATKPGA